MIWFVALGGALGSAARYAMVSIAQRIWGASFPFGTLGVNVIGGFLIGATLPSLAASATVSPQVRAFVVVGVLGGFTTFSAFSFETVTLLQQGQYRNAVAYVALSVGLSLAATLAGVAVGGAGAGTARA
jgi:CrcB protein